MVWAQKVCSRGSSMGHADHRLEPLVAFVDEADGGDGAAGQLRRAGDEFVEAFLGSGVDDAERLQAGETAVFIGQTL